uniref:DUF4132 domain-containing protein n=1 Tax=Roseihalotalea indica TaxID=2867963 RepID=A0AA49GKW7_9BACT|nr:DUF4132 domain-containing protein [Tunicatimonas sp. TK19036]
MALQSIRKILFGNFVLEDYPELETLLSQIYRESQSKSEYGWIETNISHSPTFQTLKAKSSKEKRLLVLELVMALQQLKLKLAQRRSYSPKDPDASLHHAGVLLLDRLMRQKLALQEEDFIFLFETYTEYSDRPYYYFGSWPVAHTTIQLEKFAAKHPLSFGLQNFFARFIYQADFEQQHSYWGSNLTQVKLKIETLLHQSRHQGAKVPPFKLNEKDAFGQFVNGALLSFSDKTKENYHELLHLAVQASGARPSKKYTKESTAIIKKIGPEHYKKTVGCWLAFLAGMKEEEEVHEQQWQGRTYSYVTRTFLHTQNADIAKGLVWSLVHEHDNSILLILSQLAERAFRKIPGTGATAKALGNACLYTLAQSSGTLGIGHLSLLKQKILQTSTRKLIQKYLQQVSDRLGISAYEIEEMGTPHFDLCEGKKEISFDDYTLETEIVSIGKVKQSWRKPDGTIQKTVPSFIKQSTALQERLKDAKKESKAIQKALTAQRDRLDRSYIHARSWTYPKFKEYYLEHGLCVWLAHRLIWTFQHESGQEISAIWQNNQWEDIEGNPVRWIDNTTQVTLWHPILTSSPEVLAWRQRLETLGIRQPMKQAYREVYLLTNAEVNTRFYSNRMAAHILKQHQLNALATSRGWEYRLLGTFDDGRDRTQVIIKLPEYNLEASFWITEIGKDDSFNDNGIWLYVATDQVRFSQSGEPLNLIDVPKIIFSEIMRDVDLFVGVSSVGNDPQWQDNGGNPQFRDYWTAYSFGDLTEVANIRKAVLEKIIPRLKITKSATIEGKFLKIKGSKTTYKIHIGSTNIIMEPNNQYLCIVPSRGNSESTDHLFLPFEGDQGLSILLSKAMMLAEDDKITDPTILSQLG